MRAIAKRLKTQPELARQLWRTGDTAARLLAILISRPKAYEQDELDSMLAQIGIDHAEHRSRAIDIGERLEVLTDYPTPPGCTSPFAPVWINEIVRRRESG